MSLAIFGGIFAAKFFSALFFFLSWRFHVRDHAALTSSRKSSKVDIELEEAGKDVAAQQTDSGKQTNTNDTGSSSQSVMFVPGDGPFEIHME